ncbi:PREDICTED: cytospin-A-like isoform X6 [Nicrophorus vespilloides]|uniref:Cytospin-A-like isoform X6 n=1 Tax=Nicrophorus vespilloides TaxID=110193 RepID=A0ABM1MQB0_NICVS|nr:PREDICTED: cytospin-A-like isoform X6 [Nicrophorus vespilloides]
MLRKRCVKIIGGNGAENSSQKENEGRRGHKDLIGALIAGTRKQQETPPLYPRKRLETKQPPPVPKFRKPLETQRSRDYPTPTSRTKPSNAVKSRNKNIEASSRSRPTSIDFGLRQKDQGQAQAGEDLSRASSISNLNENSKKAGALSKVRKSVSKDRLDNGEKRLDKKGCKNNNHQVELDGAGDEIEVLQKQLEAMTSEKAELVLQLGENRNQLTTLEGEIFRLKMLQEQSAVQMEQLNGENAALRNKLRDVVCSPLSDNEKQMLLLDSQRHHSSAPASIATNALNEGDATTCSTPDWDKESCSNVSEVSVACLQDKINQMQETHYSTNEELQATLQELTDLQRQLSELHQDNERLMEEKGLMFQSLCRQTERLNDARDEIDSLKQLLYKEKDTSGQYESVVEREQKLLELLKDSQEEREMLLVKLEQCSAEITDVSNLNIQRDKESIQMEERIRTLESTLDAKHAEHKLLDQEMARAKDAASSRQIEIDRHKDLLENARTKIIELEQDRTVSDKSELEELLDNARKEKDLLESEVANLKEQVARGRNEGEKLREQVSILQEEFKVMRNNGKCMQSELEYKVEKLMMEKSQLSEQLQHLDEAAKELQVQAQCHLEDKHQLSSVLSETQRNMSEVERRNIDMETELRHLEKLRAEENEEWDKFQKDLLTSVRVANDFKTEAQQELQKLVLENKTHRDKIRQLEGQLEKLKAVESVPMRPTSFPTDELTRRASKVSLNRQNSRQSVKSLIESIENAGKPLSKSVLQVRMKAPASHKRVLKRVSAINQGKRIEEQFSLFPELFNVGWPDAVEPVRFAHEESLGMGAEDSAEGTSAEYPRLVKINHQRRKIGVHEREERGVFEGEYLAAERIRLHASK